MIVGAEETKMTENYDRLLNYLKNLAVFNTHSHHYPQDQQTGMDLMKMLRSTYLKDDIRDGKTNREVMKDFNERMKYNSYFLWLEKALQDLYGIKKPLDIENIEETNQAIQTAYKNPGYHIEVLEKKCCYRYMLVDAYWNPGGTEPVSDIFLPVYRINMYLYGYSRTTADHNGNNPYRFNHWEEVADLDEYIGLMHEELKKQIHRGCVALKCAAAYDRGLDFKNTKKEDAEKAFYSGMISGVITKKEIDDFQNYVFYDICAFAAKHQIPLQCHTGLGLLRKTSAIYLQDAISDNPDTKFVLFHGNYPWMDDLCGLVCTYRNVYVDFCWLPIISTAEAGKFLEKILSVGDLSKIYWGCDTWISEDSYGALLAMRHVLCSFLDQQIEQGIMQYQDAVNICQKIMYQNAIQLYIDKSVL